LSDRHNLDDYIIYYQQLSDPNFDVVAWLTDLKLRNYEDLILSKPVHRPSSPQSPDESQLCSLLESPSSNDSRPDTTQETFGKHESLSETDLDLGSWEFILASPPGVNPSLYPVDSDVPVLIDCESSDDDDDEDTREPSPIFIDCQSSDDDNDEDNRGPLPVFVNCQPSDDDDDEDTWESSDDDDDEDTRESSLVQVDYESANNDDDEDTRRNSTDLDDFEVVSIDSVYCGGASANLPDIHSLQCNASHPKSTGRLLPRSLVVVVLINDRPCRALLDSRSLMDFVSTTVVDQLKLKFDLLEKPIPLQLAVSSLRSVVKATTMVDLKYQEISGPRTLNITNLKAYDIILGMPFLFQHQVLLGFNPSEIKICSVEPLPIRGAQSQILELRGSSPEAAKIDAYVKSSVSMPKIFVKRLLRHPYPLFEK
jgi:hypothetical protein